MVSSGDVIKQSDAFVDELGEYSTQISGLQGSWEGSSYNNFVAKAEEFATKYTKGIPNQFTSFAEACDLYKEYIDAKKKKEEYQKEEDAARSQYNQAKQDNSPKMVYYSIQINKYNNLVDDMDKEMKRLKKEIEAKLRSIDTKISTGSSPQLATGVSDIMADVDMSEFKPYSNFTTGEINGQKGTYLKYDENAVNNIIGAQTAQDCGVYAMAYGFVVLEGKCRVGENASVGEIRAAYNAGYTGDVDAQWSLENCVSHSGNRKERLNAIWDEVTEKEKPVIVATGGYYGSNHYSLVIGFKEGATKENLKPSDLIVLDSAGSERIHYFDENRLNFDAQEQYITFPDREEE